METTIFECIWIYWDWLIKNNFTVGNVGYFLANALDISLIIVWWLFDFLLMYTDQKFKSCKSNQTKDQIIPL